MPSHSLSVCSVTQSCPILCDPRDCSTPGLPVHHQLPELTQTHVHWVSYAIQLSHPLSSPSPPTFNLSQHQGLFKWALHCTTSLILSCLLSFKSMPALQSTKHSSKGKHLGYTTVPGNWLNSYLKVTDILYCASPGTSRRKSSQGGPSLTTPSTANSMEVQFKGHLGCNDVASLSTESH